MQDAKRERDGTDERKRHGEGLLHTHSSVTKVSSNSKILSSYVRLLIRRPGRINCRREKERGGMEDVYRYVGRRLNRGW